MKVKSESEVAQLCVTLRDPMDCSLPGSSVHVIFQARVLEWVAIAFSICGTTRLQSYFQKWLHHDTSPSNVKGFQFLYILKLFFFLENFKKILFIYLLFLATLGLHCFVWAFSSWSKWGLLFIALLRLLIGLASLVWASLAAR